MLRCRDTACAWHYQSMACIRDASTCCLHGFIAEHRTAHAQAVHDPLLPLLCVQDELNKLVGTSSGFIESQPNAVRRRIAFLEELQEEHDDLQDKFEEEMAALEKKYRDLQGATYRRL